MKYFTLIFAIAGLIASKPAKAGDFYDFNTMNAKITVISTEDMTPEQQSALRCMALNIYHEARDSNLKDKMGVAFVTKNRQEITQKSICDVVYERGQFSWTRTVARIKPLEIKAWDESQRIAYMVLFDDEQRDFTHGATHFVETPHRPSWTKTGENWRVFGSHVFFTMALAAR
jgi:spore germination cell wall hydrolase CwlJ-like protein